MYFTHSSLTARFAVNTKTNRPKSRSKVRSELSGGANYRSKVRGDLPCTSNYRSNFRATQHNRRRKSAGKYRRNIARSEISLKSYEKSRISSKFVCITFAQYCTGMTAICFSKKRNARSP